MSIQEIMQSDCWFAYRLPFARDVRFGAGKLVPGFRPGGFAIAPFIGGKEEIRTIMPEKSAMAGLNDSPSPRFVDEATVTATGRIEKEGKKAPQWYRDGIARIQKELREQGGGKIVFSRVIERHPSESLEDRLLDLAREHVRAFLFAFSSPATGTWYGVSPETLLKFDNGEFFSCALAGTRPVNTAVIWDEKNREEQRMVTDFILEAFRKVGLSPIAGDTVTKKAGPVEHLLTGIRARDNGKVDVERFLEILSPTPALCGSDREAALRVLKEIEREPRRMYGGWCGPVFGDRFDLFVNLRSAEVLPDGTHLQHVGGGITLQSDPEAEWEETRRKARTLFPD